MTLYYDDNQGTDRFDIKDFELPSRLKLGAAVQEAWMESYGPSAAARYDVWQARDQGVKLSAQEFGDRVKASGLQLKLTAKDNEYTDAQLKLLLDRQRELAMVKDIRERTPWDSGSLVRGAAMFGAGIMDPFNLVTAMVPWTKGIPVARSMRAAAMSSSLAMRTAGRAGFGAADAAISTAVLEPAYYGVRQGLGDDYDAYDAMANIGFGALFGGGIHSLGGAGVDAFRRAMGRELPSDAFRGLSVDEIQQVQGLRESIAGGMDMRDAARVAETYTPEMRRAAGLPDADAAAVATPPPGLISGGTARVKIGEDYEPAQWAVIEADQLTATVDKADNQFRDRSRAAYQAEIQARANSLDPSQVLSADNPLMDVGPPTISVDGKIIGGNGRTLFIQRAYEIGKGTDYRAALVGRLESLGLDPASVSGMQRPVLVRRLTRQVDVKRAAMLSNEGGSSAMSPLEQAKVDAERLAGTRLAPDADGNLDTSGNRAAVRRWVEQQPEGQRNALMTEDGMLSAAGLQRLRNAVLFQAYGDSPTLARLIEATDVGSRNVAAALTRTAGRVAEAEASIGRGELHPLSLSPDIRMAVEQFDNLRRAGTKVADYLAQVDAFGDPLTPEARLLLGALGKNIGSSRRIGDVIDGYYTRLQDAGNPGQSDMFGAGAPDRLGMLDAAIRDAESTVDTAAEIMAAVSPATREATLRAAVAQAAEGRVIDVEAVVNTDPAAGTAGKAELENAAARNRRPEAVRVADADASAAVDERLASGPKWQALSDAEAADAEASALLADTVKAGDQAWKYSRGEAPGQKKATVWQGSTARFGAEEGAPLGRFRWDMINSAGGEQAQAFGYGHYVAQQAWISQSMYRERLIAKKRQVSSYTIPDGAGGELVLSSNDQAAWVLPDGTVVHPSQKNPKLAVKAGVIEALSSWANYAESKVGYELMVSDARKKVERTRRGFQVAEVDGQWIVLNPDGEPEFAGGANSKADAQMAADSFNAGFYRGGTLEKAEADLAMFEARLAALDEVTVPSGARLVDDILAEAGLRSQVDGANIYVLDASGQRVYIDKSLMRPEDRLATPDEAAAMKAARDAQGDAGGFNITQESDGTWHVIKQGQRTAFDSKADAIAFVDGQTRKLAPGIKRYEPPKPENLRTRALAGDQELELSDDAIQQLQDLVESLPEDLLPTLQLTLGKNLEAGEAVLDGINADLAVADVVEQLKAAAGDDGVSPAVLAEFQALLDQGVPSFKLERPGSLYRAEIDEDVFQRMMLWNEPMSAQPPVVREAFAEWGIEPSSAISGEQAYRKLAEKIERRNMNTELWDAVAEAHGEMAQRRFGRRETDEFSALTLMNTYLPSPEEVASVIMNQAGIPGHAFLDGNSRNANPTNPSYNLVIYGDDVATIVDRYARQTGEIGRAADNPEGLTEALRLSFGKSTDQLIEAGRIRVVASPADIPGGPHPGDVKAATAPDGMVYVVAQNVSEREARGLVLHEVGVHVGMEQMLDPQVFGEVLAELDDAIARGESWAQAARAAVPADTMPAHVREEQLAYLVQNAPELPIVQRILAAVRAWAYRTFEAARERMTLTEADFRALAVSALHAAARGQGAERLVPAFARNAPQTKTKAFSDWFGDSKVVGPDGEPLVVYHGTSGDFDAFDKRKIGSNYRADKKGFFFSEKPKEANWAADDASEKGGAANVMPVYLSIGKPLEVDASGAPGMSASGYFDNNKKTILDKAKETKADGIVVRGKEGDTIYVAFNPTQIKSAIGNNGQFDPTNPDIRYARDGDAPGVPVGIDVLRKAAARLGFSEFLAEYSSRNGGGLVHDRVSPFKLDPSEWDDWDDRFMADSARTILRYQSAFSNKERVSPALVRGLKDDPKFQPMVIDGHHRTAAARDFAAETIDIVYDDDTLAEMWLRQNNRPASTRDIVMLLRGVESGDGSIKYSRGETPDTKGDTDAEMKRYGEAVKRAKGYAAVLRAAADKLDNDAMATAAMREAMPDISAVEIDDLLGQLRTQVKGLRGMARSARSMLGAEDRAGALQDEAMKAADMVANNIQMAAVIEKRNAALNQNVRLKLTAFVNQFRGKQLDFEGFAAALVGSERVRGGSRVSIDAEYKGFRGEWLGGMIHDVERLGLMREFKSGSFDRDIYDALYRMGLGDKADLSGLPTQAVELARIISKYQEDARTSRNRFGAWVRDLQGYITRQSHDTFKIRDVSDSDWIKFVQERMDIDKMVKLGLISESDPVSSLRAIYDDFAAGVHMKAAAGENDSVALGKGSNLAKRESVSRAIYFKDGLAAYEYNQRFGTGTLAESVVQGLDHAARSTALLKNLGTNPEATLTRVLDEYEASLAPESERRAKFRSQRGALMNMLAQVDGSVNIPGSVTAAKVGTFLRALQSMAKLGGALVSSISDLAGYGAELRYSQGKGLLSGVADGMSRVGKGRASGEQKAIASSLGVFHESMLGAISARFDSPDLMGGKTSYFMQQFFRLNGLTWWTETLRDGAALSHSHYMATQAPKAFDKIDPELNRMLGLYNIDAGKWDLLRMSAMQLADGKQYMTPDGLRTVPRAAFENYIMQAGRTVNDATIKNLQDDLDQALRVMAVDRAHHAVLEPGARTRAWMLRGTKPGTVPGEMLRYIGQFKSFSVAMTHNVLGREIYGRGYDTLGEYLKKGHGDMLGLAAMIGLYGVLGYGAMAAKDLLKGRTPRDPLDPKTMAAAMAQGGGLGLYGDFLFGEYSRMGRTFTASLAGPVLGNLDTLTDLWTRIRNGDDSAAAAFKAVLDNTPFLNLFWLRPTLDYLVLYHMQEALNPGFLRRMEKRIERDNGQTFLLPPSDVVR